MTERPMVTMVCTGNAARSVMAALLLRDRLGDDGPVEVADQPAQPGVQGIVEERPVEGRVKVPLLPLAEFAAHEESLFSRPGPLQGQKRPQVGQAVRLVGQIHLVGKGALPVNDFVMGKDQDEILGILVVAAMVDRPKLMLPVPRGSLEEFQHVMHPAHVPLEMEIQGMLLVIPWGHMAERSGFLGDHHDPREMFPYLVVRLFQKTDGFQVFIAPMDIWNPFIPARIIQIQH